MVWLLKNCKGSLYCLLFISLASKFRSGYSIYWKPQIYELVSNNKINKVDFRPKNPLFLYWFLFVPMAINVLFDSRKTCFQLGEICYFLLKLRQFRLDWLLSWMVFEQALTDVSDLTYY